CDTGTPNACCDATCRAPNCNDSNPCTTDTCSPSTGCTNTPIVGCTTTTTSTTLRPTTTTTRPTTTTTLATTTTTLGGGTTTTTTTTTSTTTTTTTTPGVQFGGDDTGCIPDSKNHLKCGDSIGKAFGKAIRAVIVCHQKQAGAVFATLNGKTTTFSEELCEE